MGVISRAKGKLCISRTLFLSFFFFLQFEDTLKLPIATHITDCITKKSSVTSSLDYLETVRFYKRIKKVPKQHLHPTCNDALCPVDLTHCIGFFPLTATGAIKISSQRSFLRTWQVFREPWSSPMPSSSLKRWKSTMEYCPHLQPHHICRFLFFPLI